jgi:hypothetical protein
MKSIANEEREKRTATTPFAPFSLSVFVLGGPTSFLFLSLTVLNDDRQGKKKKAIIDCTSNEKP